MSSASSEVAGRPAYEVFAEHPMIGAAIQRALAGEALAMVVQIAGLWFDLRLPPWPESDQRVARVFRPGQQVICFAGILQSERLELWVACLAAPAVRIRL